MSSFHALLVRFLYLLLFACFVGLSLVPEGAHWLSDHYGGWSMLGGLAAYGAVIAGTIALINRINRA